MKVKVEIEIENDGDKQKIVSAGIEQDPEDNETDDGIEQIEEQEVTPEDAERYAAVSDLANCCEYMDDSELIKVKLIVQKCMKRKAAEECDKD